MGDALKGHQQLETDTTTVLTSIEQVEDTLVQKEWTLNEKSYSQANPAKQLEREYKLYEENMVNGGLLYFNPLSDLMAQKPITDILRRYTFMSFKSIKVKIVLTTLPQQYGAIKVSKMPWVDNTEIWEVKDWFAKDPVLLPITDQSSYEVELPFLWPHPLYPIGQDMQIRPESQWPECEIINMWAVNLEALMKLTDSAVNANIQATVFASLVEPVVASPRSYAEFVPPPIEAQMNVQTGIASAVAAGVTGYGVVKTALGTTQDVISTFQEVGKTVDKVKDIIEENTPKFNHEEPAEMRQDPYGELTKAAVSGGRSLRIGKLNPTNPLMYGDTQTLHDIYQIMRANPAFVYSEFLISGQSHEIRIEPTLLHTAITRNANYMHYFSQFFKWWRGSMEVSFVFFTSPFISARMEFAFQLAPELLGSIFGDLASVVRTVKGQSTIAFEVPYVRANARSPTWADETTEYIDNTPPLMRVRASRVIGVGDQAPTVLTCIFLRPGRDFAFEDPQLVETAALIPPEFGKEKEVIEAQMDVTHFFQNVENLPGYRRVASIPQTATIEELLSRWSQRGLENTVLQQQRTIAFNEDSVYKSTWDWLAPLFLFNSGDISCKLKIPSSPSSLVVMPTFRRDTSSTNFFNPGSGMAAVITTLQPILDANLPFRHVYDVDVNASNYWPLFVTQWFNRPFASGNCEYQWVRKSPTTQFFYLLPPPSRIFWPWYQED